MPNQICKKYKKNNFDKFFKKISKKSEMFVNFVAITTKNNKKQKHLVKKMTIGHNL